MWAGGTRGWEERGKENGNRIISIFQDPLLYTWFDKNIKKGKMGW